MNLLTKYNRLLLLISMLGLFLISCIFYFTFNHYLDKQIDQDLEEETLEVKAYAKQGVFYKANNFEDLIIEYKEVKFLIHKTSLVDTFFYNPIKKYEEAARCLKTYLSINGKNYQVTVIASKFNRNEQAQRISVIIILPILVLLIIVLLVNRILMKKMWAPFTSLLINIQKFNINHEHPFEPINTTISEFSTLNNAILALSEKMKSDYSEIKLFTENASHEMMTPLAVINAKLDTMLQLNLLGDEQAEILNDLYKATAKLNKLNQSLILLMKIDNTIVSEQEEINVSTLLEERIQYFKELIYNRKLTTKFSLMDTKVFENKYLFEILINNLISNAIRHNIEGGSIEIKLGIDEMIFINTGINKPLEEPIIFERFYKDPASEGTGLGLSILKQVCIKLGYKLSYQFIGRHSFSIKFKK